MEKNQKHNSDVSTDKSTTKHDQIIEMLEPHNGTGLEVMSILDNWLTHSTRAFLTGLEKKGHVITSDKVEDQRRYRTVLPVSQ